jgi:phospholipid-binding lipoprotein MlaA
MKTQKMTVAVLVGASLLLGGCATTQATLGKTLDKLGPSKTSPDERDPFEGFNRAMFSFNDTLDRVALKPAAQAYQTVTPSFVQTGIGNFFSNIGDVWSAVNNLLQGKVGDGFTDAFRVVVNTTFGLGGLIDIGTEAGMPKHKEDFGQTLGVWGVTSGPYVVLPLFGASTMRDALATPVDWKGDLWSYKRPVKYRNIGTVVRLVDQRAAVLDAGNLIEEASLDKYVFVRYAYLQRRAAQIGHDDE